MAFSEMYHVGIIVPDVESGRKRLTELLGTVWGPVVETEMEVQDGEGQVAKIPLKMCYSTEAPYLELIEERIGTVYVCNPHSNLHHIGFFTGDLGPDSRALSGSRCPIDLAPSTEESAAVGWVYHRDALGIRIELVDAASRPMMEEYMCTPVSQ
jgi:hypothetical protein